MDRRMRPAHLPIIITFLFHISQGFDPGKPCEVKRYVAVFSRGFLPNCSPDGIFEPVQCYKQECWCVVKETGEEIANTRTKLPEIPNCNYPAVGATEIDLLKAVIKNKDDDIKLVLDSFNGESAYDFKSSSSVYALAKDYLTQELWPDFSILATVRPAKLEGGFLFAVVDSLESIIQFGLSISKGDNEYTQFIDVWYSENPTEMGSTRIARFTVPVMVGRWSRFAIGVNGSDINLHAYCQLNYAKEEYKRAYETLKYMGDSYLLIGHAGEIFAERFEGDIQELTITNDPEDAERQCEAKEPVVSKQNPGLETEYGSGSALTGDLPYDPDMEEGDEGSGGDPPPHTGDIGTLPPISGDPEKLTPVPFVTTRHQDIFVFSSLTPDIPETTKGPIHIPIKGETGDPSPVGGSKGAKGEPGLQGPPGQHGINGIPGLDGNVGLPGMKGEKGEMGETGYGEPGMPGEPGESIKGEPGERGDKGERGERGESIAGPKGEPGKSFFAEIEEMMNMMDGSGEMEADEMFNALPGFHQLRGPKGEPGNCTMQRGLSGIDGRDGVPGPQGNPGLPGARGPRGELGPIGPKGHEGDQGLKGEPGLDGSKGERGDVGPTGPQGLQGPPGPSLVLGENHELLEGLAGKPGKDGEPGTPGEKGEMGDTGKQGEKGEKGPQGSAGKDGQDGVDGVQGEPGLPGAPGVQGTSGKDGIKGEKGDSGGEGQPGPPGVPGPPGPPGSPGSSYGRPLLSGLMGDPSTNTMVKGDKGDRGLAGKPGSVTLDDITSILPQLLEKGDKGDRGDRGKDGGCKMCVGFKGQRGRRGQRGIQGEPGLSGPKGEVGIPGFPGKNGIPGAPGTPGDSIKGDKGEAGSCGCMNDSPTGFQGSPGSAGVKGEKGAQGEPGVIRSEDKVVYVPGPPGPPGPPGQAVTGPPGPPGPRGVPGRRNSGDLGSILMFSNTAEMARSSVAIPSGTLGFVIDSQKLFIRVNIGWQAVNMGPVVPMVDGDFANSIASYFESPLALTRMGDQATAAAAATGNEKVSGVLKLYALNQPMKPADILGMSRADNLCYKQAKAAKIPGLYRAVLATRLQSLEPLVFHKYRDLTVVNSKGEKLLESWSGVTRGKGFWTPDTPIYTFNGTDINKDSRWKRKHFWHGADSLGKADIDSYCRAWTSGRPNDLGVGSSFTEGKFLDKSLHTCDSSLAVLCIESTLQETYRT